MRIRASRTRSRAVGGLVLALLTIAAGSASATFHGHGSRIGWTLNVADPNAHLSPDYLIQTVSSGGRGGKTIVACDTNLNQPNENLSCPHFYHASYSPNGRLMVWAQTNAKETVSQIVLARADGGGRRTIAHPGENDFEPSFSFRGKRLLYVRVRAGASSEEIVTSDLSGGSVQVMASLPAGEPSSAVDPAWSPDGHHILYNDGGAVWIVRTNGRGAHRLIAHGANADWSPSSRQIVYVANGSVYLARADGSGRHRLRWHLPVSQGPPPTIVDYAVFSPDGKQIAFAGETFTQGDSALCVVSAAGGRASSANFWSTDGEGTGELGVVGLSWRP